MGLFSFIKEAGSKLFGGSAEAATPEDLKKSVTDHGLAADGIEVAVEGDTVKLAGRAPTQEEAEKIVLALGNTAGIAAVDTSALAVEAPAPEAVFYTVQKGDSLWKIAEAHYGKGKGAKYTEIVKANTPPVKNPDLIQPGWVLRIPPLG